MAQISPDCLIAWNIVPGTAFFHDSVIPSIADKVEWSLTLTHPTDVVCTDLKFGWWMN